jgi:hypothetical protein
MLKVTGSLSYNVLECQKGNEGTARVDTLGTAGYQGHPALLDGDFSAVTWHPIIAPISTRLCTRFIVFILTISSPT